MSYLAGSRVRSTVTFVPEAGSVALSDVTATATDADGSITALTPSGTTNTFTADIAIPDTATSGPWVVRWESSNPKIVVETTFDVAASDAANP